ncbi:hypothetical protein ACQP1G_25030 [Nocardia sp. CA-107356]|uniref:hypothetical protein n=1 Tax=Nocardia sp. CA-107356 TaxID=3239972 RepID=UPI003D94C243
MRVLDPTVTERTVARPIRASFELESCGAQEFRAHWTVSPDEPIFRGHYPGFLIFPGVCVIESAHRAASAHAFAHGRPVRLAAIEHTRFKRPVFPANRIIVSGKTFDAADGIHLQCAATVHSIREDGEPEEAARIRLRYARQAR